MSRKRNFALPNALKSKVMEVIIHENLLHEENEDPANYVDLRFTGSRKTLPPLEDIFDRHTESHLLLFQSKYEGAAKSTKSDALKILRNEIEELEEKITYKFFYDGVDGERTMSRQEVFELFPEVDVRIKAIESNRATVISELKGSPIKDFFDRYSLRMRVTAKELMLLSLILKENDWFDIKNLTNGKPGHHKLNRLLSYVHVIDQPGGNRPNYGNSYTYSSRSVDSYEGFKKTILSDFSHDPISSALEESAIDYVDNATKEIQHGLGLK
jgi:hypothetical protein